MRHSNFFSFCLSCSLIIFSAANKTFAQTTDGDKALEEVLNEASRFLRSSDCKTSPSDTAKIENLISRIRDHESNKEISAEAWAARPAVILESLTKCRNKLRRAAHGIKEPIPPPGGYEYYWCSKWLEDYLNDPKPTSFGKAASLAEIKAQREFIKKLNECIACFTSADSLFKLAGPLLTRLFVAKRCTPEIIKNYDSGQIRELMEIAKNDSLVTALEKLIASGDRALAAKIMTAILEQSRNDQQRLLTFEKVVLNWPRGSGKYSDPLLALLQHVRDENVLAETFRQLKDRIPSADTLEAYKKLRLIQDHLFANKEQYIEAGRLQTLVERAKKLQADSSALKEKMGVLPFHQVGDLDIELNIALFATTFKAVFEQTYRVGIGDFTAPDSFQLWERWHHAASGDKIPWPGGKPDIYVTGTLANLASGKGFDLHLRFFDGKDDLLLAGFEKRLPRSNHLKELEKDQQLKKALGDFYREALAHFFEVLSAYAGFEITGTGLVNREKLRSYLTLNSYFNLNVNPAYFDKRWLPVEAIYFEAFEHKNTKFHALEEHLHTRIAEAYPNLFTESPQGKSKNLLIISGNAHVSPQKAYDIKLNYRGSAPVPEEVLTVTLNYRQDYAADPLSLLQLESSARFVIQTINSYIGVNYQQVQQTELGLLVGKLTTENDSLKEEKGSLRTEASSSQQKIEITKTEGNHGKPSWTEAAPSLFLAGYSQFLIAKQHKGSAKTWRNVLGTTLLAGQVAALAKAADLNGKGIKSANDHNRANDMLAQRDDYLRLAIGSVAASALIAALDLWVF